MRTIYSLSDLQPFDVNILACQKAADRKGLYIDSDAEYIEACHLLTVATIDGITAREFVTMCELIDIVFNRYVA